LPDNVLGGSREISMSFRGESRTFLIPADSEAILNAISDEQFEKDEFLPYWAELWPSATVFITYLEKNPLNPDSAICEIGSGTGILSALCALDNTRTIATDISFQGCCYCKANMERYTTAPASVVSFDWRAAPFKRTFDCIIGTDVLYEQRWIAIVLDFLEEKLSHKGYALIADPCRTHWPAFKNLASQKKLNPRVVHVGTENAEKTTVEILRLSKCA